MKIYYIVLISLFFLFTSCEDVIDVDLDENIPQLVVDAWVNNQSEPQQIRLTTTSPYFESSAAPSVSNATVMLSDDSGNVFSFLDNDNDGSYIWTPNPQQTLGSIGTTLTLTISHQGETYTAVSTIHRVPPIDSIAYEFRRNRSGIGFPEGIYAELFARDLEGIGDAYWIKTWRNEQFLNLPQEINIAFDAAFTVGSGTDGITFIVPLRESINPIDDDEPPYEIGDTITVEIHSLNLDAFLFMEQALNQMTLGDNGIFAEPPSNVPTNIVNTDPNSTQLALGFFNVSAVSREGVRIE